MQEAQRLDALAFSRMPWGRPRPWNRPFSSCIRLGVGLEACRSDLGGKWQQHALPARCAQCPAVIEWSHFRVSLGERPCKRVRLQLVDSPDQLTPTPGLTPIL